ncbi:MAG: serine hydrolase [Bacteriovoracaceae bacterium]|nr:serine hydrolase [Bacteriovoracaceae bacterium]
MKKTIINFILLFSMVFNSWCYPADDWELTSLTESQIDQEKFTKLINYVFDAKYKTNSLLIIHRGKILVEQYENEFSRDDLQRLWSITKTISGLLLGIATQEGYISVEQKIENLISQAPSDYKAIGISDLFQMSSGIEFNEDYQNPLTSDTIQMLFGPASHDAGKYVLSLSTNLKPGQQFHYSSGDTNLLMYLLKNAIIGKTGDIQNYLDFPWKKLFEPIGIKNAVFETDESKTFLGSTYLYLSARDLARIAYLIMNQGRWENQQVVPAEWIKQTLNLAPSFAETKLSEREEDDTYGGQIWLNRSYYSNAKQKQISKGIPTASEETFLMRGYAGQYVIVIPERKLILIRLATEDKHRMDKNKMVELMLDSFKAVP